MIYIGADHRGFELKEHLKLWLKDQKYEVVDCGNTVKDPNDDYPDFGFAVGERVTHDMEGMGIVICGSGVGISIAANKVPLVRSTVGYSVEQVKNARTDDDINVLALGADFHTKEQIESFVKVFLETSYSGEIRHDRRIQKIMLQEGMGGGCCGGGGCGGGH